MRRPVVDRSPEGDRLEDSGVDKSATPVKYRFPSDLWHIRGSAEAVCQVFGVLEIAQDHWRERVDARGDDFEGHVGRDDFLPAQRGCSRRGHDFVEEEAQVQGRGGVSFPFSFGLSRGGNGSSSGGVAVQRS